MSFPPGFSTRRDFSSVILAQAIQDDVVITQDFLEVFLLVVDHDIGTEAS